jgi:hypothetical protein
MVMGRGTKIEIEIKIEEKGHPGEEIPLTCAWPIPRGMEEQNIVLTEFRVHARGPFLDDNRRGLIRGKGEIEQEERDAGIALRPEEEPAIVVEDVRRGR